MATEQTIETEVVPPNPDEKVDFEVEGEAVPEVEVVDDTPPEDRNRKPMATPPRDLTDDELTKYDESVQHRIKHFAKGYHEERRRAEAAEREREEALRLAESIVEENKRLKGSLASNQNVMLDQAKRVVASEVDNAKRKYKEAYETGDPDAIAAAQAELTAASVRAERVNSYKPRPLQAEQDEVQPQQQPAAPPPEYDPKAAKWRSENKWFNAPGYEDVSSFAIGVHTKLIRAEKMDPRSDEYYQALNSRIREKFPEVFDDGETVDAPPPPAPKRSNVVAPATRSTAPKKIVLTQTQVNIAKRLNVPLDVYARQVALDNMKGN